nr:MAG TPA: hypothetical protein [Caudoviricetes sp.]
MKAHSFSLSLRGLVCYRKSALPVVVMRLCARDEANKFLFQLLK